MENSVLKYIVLLFKTKLTVSNFKPIWLISIKPIETETKTATNKEKTVHRIINIIDMHLQEHSKHFFMLHSHSHLQFHLQQFSEQ